MIPMVPLSGSSSTSHRPQSTISTSSGEQANSLRGSSNASTHRSSVSVTSNPFKGGSDLAINQSTNTTRTGNNPFRGGSETGSFGSHGSIRSTATGSDLSVDRASRRSSKSSRMVPRVNTNPFDDSARRT